jgi:hypothetical protein
MKALVSRMLRENVTQNNTMVDVSKESLYRACHGCLDSLLHLFMQVLLFTISFHHVTLSSRILRLYGTLVFYNICLIDIHPSQEPVTITSLTSNLVFYGMK